MKYHELKISKSKSKKRVGRGISAGGGKTAGRGTKGQNSRTGGGTRVGFEGGQNPLMQRVPKLPGFTSRRVKAHTISLSDLERVKGASIDNKLLHDLGIVERLHVPVKVVASGSITSKKNISLQGASKAAVKAIEAAGGSFISAPVPRKRARKTENKA